MGDAARGKAFYDGKGGCEAFESTRIDFRFGAIYGFGAIPPGRRSLIPDASQAAYDIIIIGGGINGVGIARDAAGRGFKVGVFEQADLAGHTSSRSTKLIHGGLRYLEHWEFRLVREALHEREILLRIAPHISRALRFVLPHTPFDRPAWLIRAGLFLYDWMGGRSSLPRSRRISLAETVQGRPLKKELREAFEYSDGWVDDARLVLLNAMDASEHGAEIHTRTRVVTVSRENGAWSIVVQPEGHPQRIFRARSLVNAAGPWADRIREMASLEKGHAALRLVKGSHIVVPKLFEGAHAYILQNSDKRVLFAIPYEQHFTLIGTTDIPFDGNPAEAEISLQETEYLCAGINRYFERQIGPQDVVWSYAGVRALYDDKKANASAVTRDYTLYLDGGAPRLAPLLSIYGGKLTTYRRLAEHALDLLIPCLGTPTNGAWTASKPLPGGDMVPGDVTLQITRRHPYLPSDTVKRLAMSYGTRALSMLGEARSIQDLGRMFGAGLTEAEAIYLVSKEWACSADDILWRRTKLGLHMTACERADFEQWFVEGMGNNAAWRLRNTTISPP
jgi:glycerol-3-phosphate dehydrogenase